MCTVFTINLNDANTDDEAVHSLVDRVLGLDVRFGIQMNEVYPFTFGNLYIGSAKSYLHGFGWVGCIFLGP